MNQENQPQLNQSAQINTTPQEEKLVKVRILVMNLPSKYLFQEMHYENGAEIRRFKEEASVLSGIRRHVYAAVERFAVYSEEYNMWIAVSDDAVDEVKKINEYMLTQLNELATKSDTITKEKLMKAMRRYKVKVTSIYMSQSDALELLSTGARRLRLLVSDIEKQLAEAQNDKTRMNRLLANLSGKKLVLEELEKLLKQLSPP